MPNVPSPDVDESQAANISWKVALPLEAFCPFTSSLKSFLFCFVLFPLSCPGRVSFFSSGSENLHRVEKVSWGTRYAITVSFTCNPSHAISDPSLPWGVAADDGAASSALGRALQQRRRRRKWTRGEKKQNIFISGVQAAIEKPGRPLCRTRAVGGEPQDEPEEAELQMVDLPQQKFFLGNINFFYRREKTLVVWT